MTDRKLPTPDEAGGYHPDSIESTRALVRSELMRAGRKPFTLETTFIPHDQAGTILAELSEAGWDARYNPDSIDGDYFVISPKR